MNKAISLTLSIISAATVVTASATDAVLGFIDELKLSSQGVGELTGAAQFAQSHVIFPRNNQANNLPKLVSDRSALLIYLLGDNDGQINSLKVEGRNKGVVLGTLSLRPPSEFPASDQQDGSASRVTYSKRAWSVMLPWNWLKPGLELTLESDNGRRQVISNIEFSAPSELVLQHIRIGMLTSPPAATLLETAPALAATDYFQKIPVSRLVVSHYHPVKFDRVTLANGTVYTDASASNGSVYDGDMREQIGKSLISVGINLANYGINSSAGSSQDQPSYFSQIVVHHSQGKYANGVQQHGLSGGNGMATLYDTVGNEFSHELGHCFGLGHYPNGYSGSVHSRTAGWGYDAYRQRMIGNLDWTAASAIFVDGQQVDTFAGHPYGFDAMAGGWPMGSVSRYTQHTGYVASWIQNVLADYPVPDVSSSTGYRKWNSQTQTMETYNDSNRRAPQTIGRPVVTLVGFYDPSATLPSVIYPGLFGSYGVTYPADNVATNQSSRGCRLVVNTGTSQPFIAKLADSRMNAGEMNKFHVNVPLDSQPQSAAVQCSQNGVWSTLASAKVEKPADFAPSVVEVGRTAGYSAMAKNGQSLLDTARDKMPLASIEALRTTIRNLFGPINEWTWNDDSAMGGQIYEYLNPYSGNYDFFMLNKSGRYWYFPTNQTSNDQWTFVGSSSMLVNFQPEPLALRKTGKNDADGAIMAYYGVNQLKNWGENGTKGALGDVYVYDNPYNGRREYFMLKTRVYWYFPTDKSSNFYWQYLGDADAIRLILKSNGSSLDSLVLTWHKKERLHNWGESGTTGNPGDIYVYDNPYVGKREYFKLKTSSYWYFPVNQISNDRWEFLGS